MILLDGDVMIDLLRQYPPAMRWFDALDDEEELLLAGYVVQENSSPCKLFRSGESPVVVTVRRPRNRLPVPAGVTGGAEKGSKSKAGGLERLPLLFFGLGIVLVVDLHGLLLYNIEQQGMFHGFPLDVDT